MLAAALAVAPLDTQAGEGGGSHYVPGTRNDFLMGVFGPAGIYVRNDSFYFDYSVGPNIRGGQVVADASQKVLLNTTKLSLLTDYEIFGARYGASVALTYVLDAEIGGSVTTGQGNTLRGGNVSGLSDIYVAPLLLNWARDKQHFTFQGAFYAPTGGYDRNRALNTGRNYWTIDLVGNYTYFDPASGLEVSANGGFQYNFENPDTNYRTGNEFHLDWTVARHFSKSFAAGISGYVLTQLQPDEGNLPGPIDGSDFQSWSWGLGPSFQYNAAIGDKTLGIIGKALLDIDAGDRLTGNLYMLSLTYAF